MLISLFTNLLMRCRFNTCQLVRYVRLYASKSKSQSLFVQATIASLLPITSERNHRFCFRFFFTLFFAEKNVMWQYAAVLTRLCIITNHERPFKCDFYRLQDNACLLIEKSITCKCAY